MTVPLPDLFFGGGAAGPSTKRFYRYFCFADFWQRSWRGLAQAITLSNWTFCSGVIFLVSTPYNWTLCGGVISILTLYNWAFCSGVNFSISIQHNYSFCSGVLTILTLCNWIFCSKVQAIRFLELRWAIYLNLALTGCRIHRLTGIRRIVEYCLRCEHRANLSLIFPVLHFDLTSLRSQPTAGKFTFVIQFWFGTFNNWDCTHFGFSCSCSGHKKLLLDSSTLFSR